MRTRAGMGMGMGMGRAWRIRVAALAVLAGGGPLSVGAWAQDQPPSVPSASMPKSEGSGWTDEAIASEVRRIAGPIVEGGIMPGLMVVVRQDGRTTMVPLGAVSGSDARSPDADTLYEIGSVTKVFTSILLADMASRGEVGLDDSIAGLLPEGTACPARDGVQPTLAQLATHTSGLPRMPKNFVPPPHRLYDPYAGYNMPDLWSAVGTTALMGVPGRLHEYSNFGTGLLGSLLAVRLGKSYEEALRERVLLPLGMDGTFAKVPEDRLSRVAPGHADGEEVRPWNFDSLSGAGSLRSSGRDIARFLEVATDRGSLQEGSPIRTAMDLAWSRRIDLPLRRPEGAPPGGPGMGLGWFIARDGRTRWHNGMTGGYAAIVLVREGMGVAIMGNAAASEIDQAGQRIYRALHGEAVEPIAMEKPADLPEAALERVVGEYAGPMGGVMTIRREGTRVEAMLTGQESIRVYPRSEGRFFYRAVEAELEFDLPEDGGPATKVTLHQNGMKIPFERK